MIATPVLLLPPTLPVLPLCRTSYRGGAVDVPLPMAVATVPGVTQSAAPAGADQAILLASGLLEKLARCAHICGAAARHWTFHFSESALCITRVLGHSLYGLGASSSTIAHITKAMRCNCKFFNTYLYIGSSYITHAVLEKLKKERHLGHVAHHRTATSRHRSVFCLPWHASFLLQSQQSSYAAVLHLLDSPLISRPGT